LLANVEIGDSKAEELGYPGGRGKWASCISIVDPVDEEPRVPRKIDFEGNEAAVSAAGVSSANQEDENFSIVGTGRERHGL